MYIGKNINHLRKSTGLTQADLADRIGKTKGVIVEYEKGRSVPPASTLIQLSEIFEVSIDELLNIDIEFARKQEEFSDNKKSNSIGKNVNFLRKSAGITQTKLAELINKTTPTISDYEKGRSLPPIDVILELCRIFNVNIDEFVNKDLTVEDAQPTPVQEAHEQHKTKDARLLMQLMKEKVKELSKAIKEDNPDRYDDMNLDKLVDLIGED